MGRRNRAAASAIVVAAALLAGCSSTSDGPSASSTTAASGTSAPASTTTTKASTGSTAPGSTSVGAATTDAEGALIEASDLGGSWTRDVSSQTPSESLNQSFLGVPACAAVAPSGSSAATAESASADYDPNDDGTDPSVQIAVQYQVDVYPNEADAAAVVSVVESAEFGSCFEALLTSESDGDGTVTDLAVTPLEIPSASDLGVDAAVGVEVTASLTTTKGTAATVIHLVALQHGAALGMFTVTVAVVDGSTPPPIEVDQDAIEAAAKKLTALGA